MAVWREVKGTAWEETQSVLVMICQWCSWDQEISRLLHGAKKTRTREESWEKYKIDNE